MKQFTVSVIGCGSRGFVFASCMNDIPEKFKIVSLCDIVSDRFFNMHTLQNVKDTEDFTDPEEFFKQKRSDFLIIATPDRDHIPMALKALELGYDILVEKPLSDSRQELQRLVDVQNKTGSKVFVCHELRYAVGYHKCKELLDDGVIGRLNMIDSSERVVYWHWAQAYVRGIGASIKLAHPTILAKCSHDLDLVYWYAGSECDTVSSIGGLDFFVPENAPKDCADRCLDCKYADSCVYSAKLIYLDKWHNAGEPEFSWPYNKVAIVKPTTEQALTDGLNAGEYGRCVFKCGTEKADNQIVLMQFKNGVRATHKMIYAAVAGRRYVFYGTLGEMIFDERENTITVMPFGKEKYIIDMSKVKDIQGHGGGDPLLIEAMYDVLCGSNGGRTELSHSVESHLMGISAEESRHNGGVLVKVHK